MAKEYTELTGHLLLYSKGHYGRTLDTIADLRKFMNKWSWTPEEYYTSAEIYRIVSHSFVESCDKQQITEFIEGLFNPIKLFYVNKKFGESLTIDESISSMISLMSLTIVRNGDEIIVKLPEKKSEYVIVDKEKENK